MTTADEVEQVVQELCRGRRPYVIVQAELAQILPQENPQLLVIQDSETAVCTVKQIVAVGVKSSDLNALRFGDAGFPLYAQEHFLRRIVRVRKRNNLVRTRVTLSNQLSNAAGQDGCLARARTCYNQNWPLDMFNGLLLLEIGQ